MQRLFDISYRFNCDREAVLKKKYNILMLTPDYPPVYGGIGTHVYNLCRHLSSYGCNILVLVARFLGKNSSIDFTNSNFYEYNDNEVTVVEFNTSTDTFLHGIYEDKTCTQSEEFFAYSNVNQNYFLLKYILEYFDSRKINMEFDLIHMHDAYHAVVSNVLKKVYNIPLIVTLHSINSGSNSLIDNFRRFSVYNGDLSIFVSDSLKQKAIERYSINDTEHFKVVHNGVEINEEIFTRNTNDINQKSTNRIVFCGRLVSVKGVDILLKAFRMLCEKVEDAQLVIIGDGILKDELKLLCIQQNISDRVVFVGQLDNIEVRNYFRNSDIVAVPSREEPFGLVAIEAMSEKTCVVCSNVGGLKEIVKSGYTGMLFENENYAQLADVLIELMNNKELRFSLAENGFKEANNYSWNKTSEQIFSYYNELIEK